MQAPGQWFIDKWIEGLLNDFIAAFPIMVVMSFGVYILLGMISKSLAKLGVLGVWIYGALVIIL